MVQIEQVYSFFEAVLREDAGVLNKIENGPHNARFERRQFVFSIKALQTLLDPQNKMEYSAFKKLLYSSELNLQLRLQGAEIEVFHNQGKVDSNLYCLKAT